MTSSQKKSVELLIPVFNEEGEVEKHLQQIVEKAARIEPNYQLGVLVIDDGSTDLTKIAVARFCQREPRARYIAFTRNFGKEAAIQAGLDNTLADVAIILDSDLQHPPELIPLMLESWAGGAKIVECCKTERGTESPVSRFLANSFYRLFHLFSGLDLRGQSDYKLLDRSVIEQYKQLHERGRFFRGLIQWMHYPTKRIPFDVPPRGDGTSRWSRIKLFHYALRNITSFSALPLQLVSWCGLFTLVVGIVFGTTAIVQKWLGHALDGFTTVILLQIFFSGALMLSLGVIGHYLARIHEEIKRRPSYLIETEAGGKLTTEPGQTSWKA